MAELDKINDVLQPMYTNLTNLQGVQTNAVAKQQDMLGIVDFEKRRLKDKEESIDHAIENQKRIIYFNDNSRKIYSAWLYILIVITIGLASIFVVRLLYTRYSEIVPEFVFNIVIIAIVSIGLIISFKLWSGIRARNHYNFDELNLDPPTIGSSKNNSNGFGLGSLVGCIGSQCCTPATANGPGTKWDPSIGKCLYVASLSSPTVVPGITSIPSVSPTTAPYVGSSPSVPLSTIGPLPGPLSTIGPLTTASKK